MCERVRKERASTSLVNSMKSVMVCVLNFSSVQPGGR